MGKKSRRKPRPDAQTAKKQADDTARLERDIAATRRINWRRLRRRVCDYCGKQNDLSEPRLLVCSGCGVARYCSEACQAADWPTHQSMCCAPPMEDRYADLKSDVNELEAMGIGIGRPTLGASSVF